MGEGQPGSPWLGAELVGRKVIFGDDIEIGEVTMDVRPEYNYRPPVWYRTLDQSLES